MKKTTPKQQERLDEFDRKFVRVSDYGIPWYKPFASPADCKDFLLDSMQIAVQEERERIKKGTEELFVYHTMDSYESPMAEKLKILEVISKDDFNSLTTEE